MNDFIGNQSALRMLAVPPKAHAYLLTGPEGTGKRHLAMIFTKKLLCERSSACGNCKPCVLFDALNHPDFIMISGENEAGIDEIRAVLASHALQPFNRYRVTVIESADSLSAEAQNALLKTLEEPGQGNILVLLAEDESSLLPTVVSRCQKIALRLLARDTIEKALVRLGASYDEAESIASLSNGRAGTAITIFREKKYQNMLELIAANLRNGDEYLADRFAYIESISKDEKAVREHLAELTIFFRAALLKQFGIEDIIPEDFVQRFDPGYEIQKLLLVLARLSEAAKATRGSGNARLALESLHYQIGAL